MAEEKKSVLIGGITGSIGTALAKRLLADGWTVSGFARDEETVENAREELADASLSVVDALDPEAVGKIIDETAEGPGLDAYVHCIGSIVIKPVHSMKDEEWDDCIQRNLTSAFYAMRPSVKHMQKSGGGQIVFCSSVAAQIGLASHEAIAAAKAGLEAMARSASSSYLSRNVRVNCVAFGMMDSKMAQPAVGSEQGRKIVEALHPLGRIGEPAEGAGLIRYLLSEEASWATGQTFSLDGGLGRVRPKPKA